MDALLMCGGRGTRLDAAVEKPLLRVAGEPMVDRVRRALAGSAIERTYAVVSPNAPATSDHLAGAGCPRIETPGDGYVADLGVALGDPRVEPPVLTVAADLPLLDAPAVDEVLAAYEERRRNGAPAAEGASTAARPRSLAPDHAPSATVCVPASLKRRLGLRVESRLPTDPALAPTGVNVVGADEESTTMTLEDDRLAVNVNRREDARIAGALLDGPDRGGTP